MIAYVTPDERPICRRGLADFHTTTLKTWIGGYRNRPEEWTEPQNWYPAGVPSHTDKVIIGGYSRHRCHVATGVDDVSALSVLPGATLALGPNASLAVDGELADPLGILGDSGLSNAGTIRNAGTLILRNAALRGIDNRGWIHNEGTIYADGSVTEQPSAWGRYRERGVREFSHGA